jgi:MFS transporter, DHA2 family, multidrug resistance protein
VALILDPPLSPVRRWAITVTVMIVSILQILDTSITNVALPHMQGALSAGVEEISWVVTSYLAANAVAIPATGWLTARFGRRRFFLACTVVFTVSSFLSGLAPNVEFLVVMRVLQGLGGGPILPIAQAVLWEIFPPRERGMAMAVWGLGIVLAPTFGPTVGGWIADNWSWRWIFYVNLPFGLLGFFLASALLVDSADLRRPRRVDILGLVLMVVGFGTLQLMLDRGEREDWFSSGYIIALLVLAVCALAAFVIRELTTDEPILDLAIFGDRNFALSSIVMAGAGLGFYASMLLLALLTQKLMGYDAWTSGLVLAPAGLGQATILLVVGRYVSTTDQRVLLSIGLLLNGTATYLMSHVTLSADFWALAWPRFVQGVGMGFIFVPLQTLALGTVPVHQVTNAAAALNMVRNIGGGIGIAFATATLARRSQFHQSTLASHVDVWSPETADRLRDWTDHFWAQGADMFTAERRAMAMLYRNTVEQAQVLAYADDFRLISALYWVLLLLIVVMQRVRLEKKVTTKDSSVAPLPVE